MGAPYGLLVYGVVDHPLPVAVHEHLSSFREHSSRKWLYLNLGVRAVPSLLARVPIDLIVFHTSFLGLLRWSEPEIARRLLARAQPLKQLPGARAVLPQDEFLQADRVNAFIGEFEVAHI